MASHVREKNVMVSFMFCFMSPRECDYYSWEHSLEFLAFHCLQPSFLWKCANIISGSNIAVMSVWKSLFGNIGVLFINRTKYIRKYSNVHISLKSLIVQVKKKKRFFANYVIVIYDNTIKFTLLKCTTHCF